MPDELHFRKVMGHFATGVTVVTSRTSVGEPRGLTASAVSSVSLRPLLLLVCLGRRSATRDAVLGSGVFAVNVLSASDRGLAKRFARGVREERFDGLAYDEGATGCPLLADALAWLDCRVHDTHEVGDHTVVIGEVSACEARPGDPLVYFRGRFGSFAR